MLACHTRQLLVRFLLGVLVLGFTGGKLWALDPVDYVVPTSAQVQVTPPKIILSWPADIDARAFNIYRKTITDTSWGNAIAVLPANATSYVDTNVIVGNAYEYQIEEPTDYFPYPNGNASEWKIAYGYIYAGIQSALTEDRGKVILIVDNSHSTSLSSELTRLQQDLVGDGWTVLRHDVSPSASVVSVKALIQVDYNADPNVKAVFLFGHVPVPYSGDLNPDGHSDHKGAWPADAYYGEMNSTWTDSSANDSNAQDSRNFNIPGDGKFDHSVLPSNVELQVGRVDLYDLPAFLPKTDVDLLRQYLNKDHNFRLGNLSVQRRGLLCDNFGELDGESPAASAWRNFAPLFGPAAPTIISAGQYFSTLGSQDYLWSYGCGPGGPDFAQGIGNTGDFASTDVRTVFTMLFGSYFGDWDQTDDFLRAPLASTTYGLTCTWAGFPHWAFHPMALGQTIGYSTLISQNNTVPGLYKSFVNSSAHMVHMALMGDPTLRMHPVKPPTSVTGTSTSGVILSWTSSADTVQGYHVYRSPNATGPFTRLTSSLLTNTSYTDTSALSGSYTYMVRAVKLETSGSGTYFNPSQGAFFTLDVNGGSLSCLPGPSGLVNWWPGDSNANDIQGANHGIILGGTTFTSGEVGLAFSFDGQINTMSVGAVFASVTNNFTMQFWANPLASRASTVETNSGITGTSGQRYVIYPTLGAINYGAGHAGVGISVGTNGISVFEHTSGYLPSLLVWNATVTNWTHIAVVYANNQPLLYVNGVLKRTGLTSTNVVHPSGDMSGPYGYFKGGVDEVTIYNRVLSATEIQGIYNAGSGGMCKTIQVTNIKEVGGHAQLTIQGKTGSFGIDTSTNLALWTPLVTLTNATGIIQYTDQSTNLNRRFYRSVTR
ncbi:MAG: hypothetical protein JWQ71_2463 [Pedosphaera sp.]|nr:hypothetical protein [Pedosphaera sp.]